MAGRNCGKPDAPESGIGGMIFERQFKAAVSAVALIAAASALSGCLGPTYGTDKTAAEHLFDDVSNIARLGPPDRPDIEYRPRPELVEPASTATLPPPQEPVASAENPRWPESPEQTRARLIAEADEARKNNSGYVSPLANPGGNRPSGGVKSAAEFRMAPGIELANANHEEFRRRKKIAETGTADARRFLSEPPLEYRKPAPTAPIGDLGTPEKDKERQQKIGRSWREKLPF